MAGIGINERSRPGGFGGAVGHLLRQYLPELEGMVISGRALDVCLDDTGQPPDHVEAKLCIVDSKRFVHAHERPFRTRQLR